jgi:hypothetical protein
LVAAWHPVQETIMTDIHTETPDIETVAPVQAKVPNKHNRSSSGSKSKRAAKPKTKPGKTGPTGTPKKKATRTPSPKKTTKTKGRSGKGVKTTTRSGKKITRTKAGGKGVLAAKGLHLLVVRVPKAVHAKVWAKIKADQKKGKKTSVNAWVASLIAKAA